MSIHHAEYAEGSYSEFCADTAVVLRAHDLLQTWAHMVTNAANTNKEPLSDCVESYAADEESRF